MSQYYQQPNGYTNGLAQPNTNTFRRWDLDTSSRETSDAERSRSRPGQDRYARQQSQPEQVQSSSRLDRGTANRRSREYESRSRSRPGGTNRYGGAGQDSAPGVPSRSMNHQVEDILRYIENHWSFMANTNCVPIKVALQLMDPSSLGLAADSEHFHQAHQQLQSALKMIVNEHHQGFNSSIGTFHKIQQAIHTSQHRVRTLRAGLLQAKGNLSTQRPELKALAQSTQSYDAMLRTIEEIEQLQVVPDELEAQIREKRYLTAVDNLLEALKLIRKPEMEEIGALGELRVRLSNQEQILTDMLIEELHNHLYLKSPYCEERWKTHLSHHQKNNSTATSTSTSLSAVNGATDDERAMQRFLDGYDGSAPMQEDPSRNVEADTFYFIQLLLESLHRMSRLDVAVDKIEERLPLEFHRLLERTLAEVEQRHPSSTIKGRTNARQKDRDELGVEVGERKAVLEDLLSTLFAKFEAIAEAHRVLHDVTTSILGRNAVAADESASLNRSFRELWKLLQSEMRSLLHDHLATNAGGVGGRSRWQGDKQDALSAANIFKTQQSKDREKRKMFRLTESSTTSGDLADEKEDLESIFKTSVPGLVNASKDAAKKDLKNGFAASGDVMPDRSATGHKLLVEPSVFNMAMLLPPSLTFLTNLRSIVPPPSTSSAAVAVPAGTLTTFLDDFLLNVFYPQLDETLADLCGRSMSDLDTFQPDPAWAEKASRPIFQGTARFFQLIERFCTLLDQLPHEQSFAQLVVSQMRVYYDRCYRWSKSLMVRVRMSEEAAKEATAEGVGAMENPNAIVKMRMAAELATSGEVYDVVLEILKLNEEDPEGSKVKERQELAQKEAEMLLRLAKRRELEDADLIHDRKALAALCTLQVSMKWLASKCQQLRFLSPWAVDTANTQAHRRRTWTGPANVDPSSSADVPSGAYLPLDEETAEKFDAVIISFTELSTLILRTLHIDLRLHLLQGVYKSMDTTYLLNQPYNDPDPNITALSTDLSSYSATISTHLLPPQNTFLTAHLSNIVSTALTGLISSIPAMDSHGNSRMSLNVLVLQQSLKNVQPDANLAFAARFYELGAEGPQAVVEKGPNEGYAREDLKALTRLCWDDERDREALGEKEKFVMRLGGWPKRTQSLKRGERPGAAGRKGSGRGE